MATNNRDPHMDSPHRRKSSRKSWVDQSPVDPMTDIAREETLLLTHFTKKPTICFGKVKVGKTLNRKLYVTNPHDYDQGVLIEKFPHDMGFTVNQGEFVVPGESTLSLKLTWTPQGEGGCRQMVRFLVDDSYRLQAILYGTAEVPRQKKVAKRGGLLSKSVLRPFSVMHTPNLVNLQTYNTSTERAMVSDTPNVGRALKSSNSKSKENRQPPVKKSSTAMTKSPAKMKKGRSAENRKPSDEFKIPPFSKPKSAEPEPEPDPEPRAMRNVKERYHSSQSGTDGSDSADPGAKAGRSVKERYHSSQSGTDSYDSADPGAKARSVKERYYNSQSNTDSPETTSCVSYPDSSPEQYESEYTEYTESVEEHTTMVTEYQYVETEFFEEEQVCTQEQVTEFHSVKVDQWKECEIACEIEGQMDSPDDTTETQIFDYAMSKRQKPSPKESVAALSPRRETYLVKKQASQRRRSWRNRMSSPTLRATIPEMVNAANSFLPSSFTLNSNENFLVSSPCIRNATFKSDESGRSGGGLLSGYPDSSVLSSCGTKERLLKELPVETIDQSGKDEVSPKSDGAMSSDSLNSKDSSASSVEALLTSRVDPATEKAIKATAGLIYDFRQTQATPALPEKSDPQHGRRSTHVVKEPKIVCGQGKLKQKQLFSTGLTSTPTPGHDVSYARPIEGTRDLTLTLPRPQRKQLSPDTPYMRPLDESAPFTAPRRPRVKTKPPSPDVSFVRPLDNTPAFTAPRKPQVKTSSSSATSASRNSVSSRVRLAQKAVRMTNREQISQSVHDQTPRSQRLETSEKSKTSYLKRSSRSTIKSVKKTEITKTATNRSYYSPKKCGVAQSRLVLGKREKTVIPKHPMPFASKNIYYDDRWMQKQEWSFTHWFNFILTPVEDYKLRNCPKVDAGSLLFNCKQDYHLAPSKEVLSFEAYAARRRLNRLRKLACRMFQSADIVKVVQKVEQAIDGQRFVVRKDRPIHADIGLKQNILNWILSYNPLWLRIGLEMVYGEVLLIDSNTDILGLSKYIITRLVGNPDIASEFAHPTVPHLYRDGYQPALAKHTLKKFLILVYFLDYAKTHRLIEHDPCLFCKDSEIKSSRDFLLQFSRDFLSGEGDITRHLSYLGYKVSYVQTPLDEFDYAVTNLATDLRDGVRLTRVVEVLTGKWGLTKGLRFPAISRLQKIHNLEKVLKDLNDNGTSLDLEKGKITAKDIVEGHREKTLTLLWRLVTGFQVDTLLDYNELDDEIACLNRSLKKKIQIRKAAGVKIGFELNSRRSSIELNTFENAKHRLLFTWVQTVCAHYGLKIENFTVSFSDGRVLCYLIHHYYPGHLPLSEIRQQTTVTFINECESQQVDSDNSFEFMATSLNCSPRTGKPKIYQELLANEAENFKLLAVKVSAIGCVPTMLRHSDMSNTIPDEKVVITYVTYLAIRLLEIRHESRAAILIQLAWREYQSRKKRRLMKLKPKSFTPIPNNAEILQQQETHHTPDQSSPLRQQTPTSIKTAHIPLSEHSGDRHSYRSISDYSPIRPIDMEPVPASSKKGKVLDTILESSTVEGPINPRRGSDEFFAGPSLGDGHKDLSLGHKIDGMDAGDGDEPSISRRMNRTREMPGHEQSSNLQQTPNAAKTLLNRPCADASVKRALNDLSECKGVASPTLRHSLDHYSPITSFDMEPFPMNSKKANHMDTILESSTVEGSVNYRRGSQEGLTPFMVDAEQAVPLGYILEAGYNNASNSPKLNTTIDFSEGIVKGHEGTANLQTPSSQGSRSRLSGAFSAKRGRESSTNSRRSSQLNVTIELTDGSLLSKSDLPTASPGLCNDTYNSDSSMLQSDMPNVDKTKVAINETFDDSSALQSDVPIINKPKIGINETFDGDGETCPQKSDSQSNLPVVDVESRRMQNETFEKICPLGSGPNSTQPTQPDSKQRGHNETFEKETHQGSELNSSVTKVDSQGNKTFDSEPTRPELRNALPCIAEHAAQDNETTADTDTTSSRKSNVSDSDKDRINVDGSLGEDARTNKLLSEVDGEYNPLEQQHIQNEKIASNKRQSGCEKMMVKIGFNQTIELSGDSRGPISEGLAAIAESSFDHGQQNVDDGGPEPSGVDGQILNNSKFRFSEGPNYLADLFNNSQQDLNDCEIMSSEILAGSLDHGQQNVNDGGPDGQILNNSKYRFSEGPNFLAALFNTSQQDLSNCEIQSSEIDEQILNDSKVRFSEGPAFLAGLFDTSDIGNGEPKSDSEEEVLNNLGEDNGIIISELNKTFDSFVEDDALNNSYVCQVQHNESVSFSRQNKTLGEDEDLNSSFVCQVQYASVSFSKLNKTPKLDRSNRDSPSAILKKSQNGSHIGNGSFSKLNKTPRLDKSNCDSPSAILKKSQDGGHLGNGGHVGNGLDTSSTVDSKLQNGLNGTVDEDECDGADRSESRLQGSDLADSSGEWIEEEFILKNSRARTKEMIADRETPEPSVRRKDSSAKANKAVLVNQNAFRRYAAQRRFLNRKTSAIAIQRWYRCRREIRKARENYETLRATVVIQSTVRAYQERKRFLQKKKCIVSMQQKRRALVAMRSARSEYLAKVSAAQTIQRWRRAVTAMWAVRADFEQTRNSVVKIQSLVRMRSRQRDFQKKKGAAISIQQWYHSLRTMQKAKDDYSKVRKATLQIQSLFRAHRQRKQYLLEKESALQIQKSFRMYSARKRFLDHKNSAVTIQQWYRCQREMRKARHNFQHMKGASLVIQSAVRSHLTRQRFLKTKQCLISLQQRRRGLVLMRTTRTEYLATKKAIETIQRWYRAVTKMRTAKDDFENTRKAIVKIQSFVRQRNAQREFLQKKNAALHIQNWFRATLLMKDQRYRYVSLKVSTIQIQAAFRGQRQRKSYLLQRESAVKIQSVFRKFSARRRYVSCRNSAVTIQQWYRSTIETRKARKSYESLRAAALVIQSNVKAYQERKRFLHKKNCVVALQQRRRAVVAMRTSRTEYLAKRCASKTIQRWYRAVKKMQKARDYFEKTKNAIVKIQSLVRMTNQKKEFLKKKGASVSIQNWYRAVKNMQMVRDDFEKTKRAIVKIQSLVRMRNQKKEFLKKKEASVSIQRWYRAVQRMREARDDFEKTRTAIVKIQSLVRMRNQKREYLTKKDSSVSIQRWYRAIKEMRTVRDDFEKTRNAVLKIQSLVRMTNQKREFLKKKEASVSIQRWYRAVQRMREARDDFTKTRTAVVKIQSLVRMRYQKKEFLKKKDSSVSIQRWYRAIKEMRTVRDDFEKTRTAVVKIQSLVRMTNQKKQFLKKKDASLSIQRWYRAVKKMQKVRDDFQRTRTAVIKIQSRLRMRSQQKEYLRTKEATVAIQRWYLAVRKMRESRKSYISMRESVILIQALFRTRRQRKRFVLEKESSVRIQEWYRGIRSMRLARTKFLSMKSSAVKIQQTYKSYCLMRTERTNYLHVRSSIIKLQSRTRMVLARRRFVKQKQSAVVIQKWYRSVEVMVEEKNVYRAKRSAAVKLQSVFRGYLQRKAYLEERRSIVKVQSIVRTWIVRRKWLAKKSAAILIQKNYRSRLALRRLRETIVKRHESAICIQSWFRQKLISWRQRGLLKIDCDCCSAASLMKSKKFADIWLEKTRRRKLNAVLVLQKYWLKWYIHRTSAATTIQTIVRGWLVRRRLAQQKSAAIIIQKHVRCWHTRRTFKKTKESTSLLQPVIRGWLVRNRIKKRNHAATAIQSLWRGYKVRCCPKRHPAVTDLRKRLVDVTKKATDDKKLSNRFALGFDHLMKFKQLSEVLQALKNLEVGCRLSPVCCVQLAKGHAGPIIFNIIRGCNRSIPHMELIKYSIQILLNLAKYAPTVEAVYDCRPDAIEIIMNVLVVFREKGLIFSKACILLGIIALDMQEKGNLDELMHPQFKEKILSLYKLTERKYKREETRVTTRARMASGQTSEFCMTSKRAKIGPDWLLGKKRMREIKEPLKAMTYLMYCLDLHAEITPTPQKTKTRATKK